MTKNVIQLNGNTYDISSGKLISSNKSTDTPRPRSSVYVDGYIKPQKKPKQRTEQIAQNPVKKPIGKSQTLMRNAVSKPAQQTDSEQKHQNPLHATQQKRSFVNFGRIERAARSAKSSAVRKFNPVSQDEAQHRPENLPQQPQNRSNPQQVNSTATPSTKSNEQNQQESSQSRKQTLEQNALARATSHEKTYDDKRSFMSRWRQMIRDAPAQMRYGAAALLMIGGIGVIGYASMPYASVRIASSRSSVNASLPAYRPSGFALNRTVEYSPEHIALQYDSVSDGRTFHIKKEQTNWTSESLRASFVETKGLYQTIPSNGKTIYIYNDSNATWVDGGVWYKIEGASSLNSDQLLRLANSL